MSKRFYWLKLKDDFFDNEKIKIMESMENGKDYIIFLLKLQVKSIKNVGHLRLNADIPYNEQMLATITNTNIDVVRSAIKILQQIGLLQILDDGTYFMAKVAELTGSEVDSAERVRQHRIRIESDKTGQKALQCNNDVTKCNTDIEIEKELEKEYNTSASPVLLEPSDIPIGITEFESIWKNYPNKDGKKEALKHFKASVKTPADLENIKVALTNYLASKPVKSGYIKNGSTWFNNWQDWIEVGSGFKSPQEDLLKQIQELK